METQEGKVNGHGTEPQAIIPAPPTALAPGEQTVEQMLARSEKQVAFRKGILKLIAANLEPEDVTLYGEGDKETVHLTKHACKQILSWAGISVQPDSGILEKKYEGTEGPYIDFEVWGTWIRGTEAHRSMGNRSTYDDFFAKRTKWSCEGCGAEIRWDNKKPICVAEGKQVKAEKTTYYLPLSEVDIPSIKQAAITNLWNHIVEDAGLKPSKKELQAVGFRFDEVKDRVKFGENKNPGPASQQPLPSAPQGAAAPKQTTAAPTPSAKSMVPKANLGGTTQQQAAQPAKKKGSKLEDGTRSGVVTTAYLNQGSKGRYVKLTLNDGATLFCFHDGVAVTRDGDKNLLELLVWARNKHCTFITKANAKGETIEGARKIGPFEWDSEGMPVLQREPGDDGYKATDEDLAF
jgi:hypothetical protein